MNDHQHEHEMRPLFGTGYSDTYIKLAQDRMIFLAEDVSKKSAAELSALLLYYDNQDHEAPITLHLHSNGGDAAGLANIYDVMQMIQAPIITVCIGKCYSAAAVILAAGTKGERYAMKSSKIMIHGVQAIFPIPSQNLSTSKNYYEFLDENNDNIMKILSKHTEHSLEKIKEDCKQDFFMNATEALKYNIIDWII